MTFPPCLRTTGRKVWLVLLHTLAFHTCHASIFLNNETYPSLPGLFGKALTPGKRYRARVQYLRENSYLCLSYSELNRNSSSFVTPPNVSEPIVLLAARGHCPFHFKAAIAEGLDGQVQFLIVYNYAAEGEDMITPMYSEYGDTRLRLLSVSHRTGHEIKRAIAEASDELLAQGGPWLEFDDSQVDGMLSVDDVQELLMSALGFMFMMISFAGCMIVGASLQAGVGSRIVISSEGGIALTRTLLTEEEIRDLSVQVRRQVSADENDVATGESTASPRQQYENACAVCIEEFESHAPDDEVLILPCRHKFHADCIIPWLTERQAHCPLCKFDVMQYINEQPQEEQPIGGDEIIPSLARPLSWFDRWTRRRWSQLGYDEDHVHNHAAVSADEMEVEEVEMREHHGSTVI